MKLRTALINLSLVFVGIVVLVYSIGYWINVLGHDRPYFDDSFMYARYAINLLDGNGYAWNADGVLTYGCTDIVFTYLVTGAKFLFPNVTFERILLILPAAIGFFAVWWMTFLVYRILNSNVLKKPKVVFTLLPAAIVTYHYFSFHSTTGMDTMLSFSSNVLLIYCFFQLNKSPGMKWAVLAAFSAYFTFLVRPDNAIYAVLFPACFFLLIHGLDKKSLITYVVGFLSFIAIDFSVKTYYFGNPLPLPFYAKTFGYYEGYLGATDWNPIDYIYLLIKYTTPFLIILIVTITWAQWRYMITFLLPVYLTVIYYFGIDQIMGTDARYYIPSIPFIVVAACLALDHVCSKSENLSLSYLKSRKWRVLIVLILIPVYNFSRDAAPRTYSHLFLDNARPFIFVDSYKVKKYVPVAPDWWHGVLGVTNLYNQLPEGTVVTASENGYLSAKNPHLIIIDLAALHDRELALNGFSTDYILSRKPEIIWLANYTQTRINYEIVMNPRFRENYYFVPHVFSYGIAISKDSPEAYRLVENEIKTLYGLDSIDDYIATFLPLE